MSSGYKPDILWSPHHADRYVICDTELSLYRIGPAGSSETKAGALPLSEETAATLLAINSDTPVYEMCGLVSQTRAGVLLAVGQANGRVVLTSLGQSNNSKCKELVGKEFVPKHARQCNTLAWNPVDSNWLAAGLDKHRADFSVLIWDISSKFSPEAVPAEKVRLSGDVDSGLVVTKPLYELGQNDACLSLCWLPRDHQKLLLAGMHRNLAIFDLRNTSQKTFVNTKAIQGVTVDPHFQDRVASFFEGQVAIWDLRKFENQSLLWPSSPKLWLKWHGVPLAWACWPRSRGTATSSVCTTCSTHPCRSATRWSPPSSSAASSPAARASSAASPGIRLPRTAWWWCRPTGSWTTSPSLSAYRWPGAPPRRWCGRAGGTCMSARRTPDRGGRCWEGHRH